MAVNISHTPAEGEDTNNIVITSSGELVSVPNCKYDAATGTVTFTTTHVSDYAVGYNNMGNKVEESGKVLKKKSKFEKFLDGVERVGNKLPDPVIIFAVLTAAVTVFSLIGTLAGWSVKNPTSGDTVTVFNLLSADGIQYMGLAVKS